MHIDSQIVRNKNLTSFSNSNFISHLRLFLTIMLFLSILLPAASFSSDKPNVAILMLEVAGGVPASYAPALTDRLRQEIYDCGVFRLMERGEMDEILQEIGFQQSGCTSNECLIQAGRILGVQNMIAGSVSRMGEMYTISLRLIDVETAEILRVETVDCMCTIEEVLTTRLKQAAYKLAGLEIEPSFAGTEIIGMGSVRITSSPAGASIFLDERIMKEKTPATLNELSAGKHSIRLEKGNLVGSKQVFILPGIISEIDIPINPGYGILTVKSTPPGGEVALDGEIIGQTPLQLDTVQAGEHVINISLAGYADYQETIHIGLNLIVKCEVVLEKMGEIWLASNPQGVKVYIKGKELGTTPLIFQGAPGKEYKFSFRSRGYKKGKITAIPQSGILDTVNVDLIPKSRGTSLALSAILPGSGQIYAGKTWKGWGILAAQIATGYLAYNYIEDHKSKVVDYNEARECYLNTVYPEDITQSRSEMDKRYDETEDAKRLRDAFIIGATAVYLYNLFDISVISCFPDDGRGFNLNLSHDHIHHGCKLEITFGF